MSGDENEMSRDFEKLIDHELLTLISKLAFQNTNMNSNWKVFFLRNILRSIVVNEGFAHLKQDLEVEEFLQAIINSNSVSEDDNNLTSVSSTTLTDTNSQSLLTDTAGLKKSKIERRVSSQSCFKSGRAGAAMSHQNSDTSIDDLKLNLKSQAVLGVCDDSALFLITPDDALDSYQTGLNERRNKFSLKLFENSIEKISNFYINNKSSTITSTRSVVQDPSVSSTTLGRNANGLSKQTPLQQSVSTSNNTSPSMVTCIQPAIRNTIKLISNAITVLTCRELVILFINLAARRTRSRSLTNGGGNTVNVKLNCQTEYEFLQLTDILYYTESLLHYRLFIKNLISNLIR
jgi:hypothetical protein